MKWLFKIIVALVLGFPFCAYAEANEPTEFERVIQLTLEKDKQGNSVVQLIDTKGKKRELTLGDLLSASAEAWMDGSRPQGTVKIDPKAIATIRLDKEGSVIKTYLFEKNGHQQPLTLGNLLSASAVAYPGCTPEQIDGQLLNFPISFSKDEKGYIHGYYEGKNGKEDFNLGVLFREATLLLNQCTVK